MTSGTTGGRGLHAMRTTETYREVAVRFGHKIDHVVHFDNRFVIAANTGEPYALHSSRWFGRGRELRRLVREIEAMGADAAAGSPGPAAPQNGESHNGNGQPAGLGAGDVQ